MIIIIYFIEPEERRGADDSVTSANNNARTTLTVWGWGQRKIEEAERLRRRVEGDGEGRIRLGMSRRAPEREFKVKVTRDALNNAVIIIIMMMPKIKPPQAHSQLANHMEWNDMHCGADRGRVLRGDNQMTAFYLAVFLFVFYPTILQQHVVYCALQFMKRNANILVQIYGVPFK